MSSNAITTDNAFSAITDWSELAGREYDGLGVSLLWHRTTDAVRVMVVDSKLGEEFELEVAGADALEAFYHPLRMRPPEACASATP